MVWAARSSVRAVSKYSLPRCDIENVIEPSTVLRQLLQADSEPRQPVAINLPASFEAIDALPGTKRGSPRVVPDETKLAITSCASFAGSRTFRGVGHCSLLLKLYPHTPKEQPRGVRAIRNLADHAGVRLRAEHVRSG